AILAINPDVPPLPAMIVPPRLVTSDASPNPATHIQAENPPQEIPVLLTDEKGTITSRVIEIPRRIATSKALTATPKTKTSKKRALPTTINRQKTPENNSTSGRPRARKNKPATKFEQA